MNEKLASNLKSISLFFLAAAFITLPLFFLPLTTDFFSFNKQVLFFTLTSLSLLFWLGHNLVTKTVRLTLSPLLLPLTLFSGTIIASTIFNPSNSDTWMGRPILYLTLFAYFILLTTLIQSSNQVKKILHFFLIVTTLLSLWGILSILGVFESLNLPRYLTLKTFSPLGSPLNLVSFLITALPISLTLAFKIRSGPKKLQYFLSSGLIISAIILVGYQLLPSQDLTPALLPKLAGWSIAVDTFKSQVLLGSGPSNFVNQFTRFRPVSLNQTPLWNILFTTSSNEYLHLMTTLGLLGLVTFLTLIYSWIKLIKRDPGTRITSTQQALKLSTTTLLILGLFIPFSPTLWLTLISLFALTVGTNKSKNLTKVKDVILTISAINVIEPQALTPESKSSFSGSVLPWLLAIPVTLGIFASGFYVTKAYAAEYYFQKSLVAIDQNKGQDTYNFQIKAINQRPQTDRFHVAYSNTNLALANSLASQGDLTDQERQTIAQLIQQAIREARTATQLSPQKSTTWNNLANTYRQLVNFADGSADFSIAAYTRAIQLDPANPRLRLELGGLLFSLDRFDEAVTRFQEAIQLKPDYANAHYNLSNTFKKQQKYLEAYQTMQQVITLIPVDSTDFSKAQTELNELEAMLPQSQTTKQDQTEPTQELTEPSPLPIAPKNFEPIPLESPTPTPNPTSTPSPSL